MRILYGLSGEGFGHSSRALLIGEYLRKKGHKILFVTYGQALDVLEGFSVLGVGGLEMVFEKGMLRKRKTLMHNLKKLPKYLLNSKIYKRINRFKPDICISDMEALVPIYSYWTKLPLISFDNQHRLSNFKLKVPRKYKGDYFSAKSVVNLFVRNASYFIVTGLRKYKPIKENTIFIPPLIRPSVRKLKPKKGKKILVYLSRDIPGVLDILKQIDERFVVFGYNVNKKEGNLEFKTREHFLKELKNCKAIIASSGYTLISEAVYLKKPYYAVSLKGQFEQVLNGISIKKLKIGDWGEEVTKRNIERFLKNLNKYEKALNKYNPDYDAVFSAFDFVLDELGRS